MLGRTGPAGQLLRPGAKQNSCLTLLHGVRLFTGLPEAELEFVTRQSTRLQLDADQILFIEGEPCKGLYVVESGLLKLYKISPDGREQVLATFGPGYTLSELPMIDGGTHPFCSAAIAPSRVLFIPAATVRGLCSMHAECAQEMLRILAERMRSALAMIEELSFSPVQSRLAAYLLRLAASNKTKTNAASVHLPASHEIAAQIGTVRELVSRHLSRLQMKGLIRISRRTVLIPDLRRLAREITGAPRRLTQEPHVVNPSIMHSTRPGRIRAAGKSGTCSAAKRRASRTAE